LGAASQVPCYRLVPPTALLGIAGGPVAFVGGPVAGFLAQFENVPNGNYAIVETRKVSEGPVGVGTTYQQVRSVPSRSEERFEVTVYNPPRHLEIQGQLGPFPSRLSYALDALPEGTRVTNTVELELRGPGRLLGRVAMPRVRDAVAANLRKLKEVLER
jgi:hypothetical protein